MTFSRGLQSQSTLYCRNDQVIKAYSESMRIQQVGVIQLVQLARRIQAR